MINILKRDFRGFTLAEVLITLGIIGVVAALIIPSLINKTKDAETATAVQKAQSTLNNAVQRYMADNNCLGDLSSCGAYTDDDNAQKAWNAIKPYLNIAKDCGTATNQGCFSATPYKYLNPTLGTENFETDAYAKAVLSDGQLFRMSDTAGNCNADRSRNHSGPFFNICGWMGIDVNGKKGPNVEGLDYFSWRVTKTGQVYPYGSLDDSQVTDSSNNILCNRTATNFGGNGWGCTAKILKDGAINY